MQSMIRKRRFSFPHPDLSQAQLEPIQQPLYSMAVYDNAAFTTQRELFFFRYAQGQTLSGLAAATGTVASSVIHTNMETGGFLSTPKVFLASGLRIIITPLTSTLAALKDDNSTASETPTVHSITDHSEIFYGTYFRFFVGTRDYLTVPTWAVPGNTGVGGMVATDVSVAVTVGPNEAQIVSANTSGRYFDLQDSRILIPSQQAFFTSLNAPHSQPPTLAAEAAVYSVIDGVLGREVQ